MRARARAEDAYRRLTAAPGMVADGSETLLGALEVAQYAAGAGDGARLARGIADAAMWAGAALAADEGGRQVHVRLPGEPGDLIVPAGAGRLTPPLQLDGIALAALARDPVALDWLCRPGTAERGRQRALVGHAVVGGEAFWVPLVEAVAAVVAGRPLPAGAIDEARTALAADRSGPLDPAALSAINLPLLALAELLDRVEADRWPAAATRAMAAFETYRAQPDVAALPAMAFPLRLCGICAVAFDRHGWRPPATMPNTLAALVERRQPA